MAPPEPEVDATSLVVELSAAADWRAAQLAPAARWEAWPAGRPLPEEGACLVEERQMALGHRRHLCFWFQVSELLQRQLNGSSWTHVPKSGARLRESLVEAELHLFKLLPNEPEVGGVDWWNSTATPLGSRFGSQFNLKTNLLEVRLYQILPAKLASNKQKKIDQEPPLRLLDIRRMDLNSRGWETFFVKRALEDWIKDASLNLGLVIKAKSMFDEPIEIGLIKFADLQLASSRLKHNTTANNGMQRSIWRQTGQRHEAQSLDEATVQRRQLFNQKHQPILVAYTTLVETPSAELPAAAAAA